MADELDNLVLQYLRRIDAKIDRLGEDTPHVIKVRLTGVDEGLDNVQRWLDWLEARVEHRLNLVAQPH